MYKYSYESSRGKKVWINAFKEIERNSMGAITKYIIVSIELNIIDNENKIVWINFNNGENNLYDFKDLPEEYKANFIKESMEFANKKGYLNRFKNK